ncbi:D-galactonate transporter [Ralstonia psammae]|uniref:D-galactonate transporter n=1 Tax=Ralstonia psammae TaxID=3058598 RepID=A0ABN9JGU5_9RALS|nr:MFS transporter [Ralstonia sp. LMG 19083]CAJ0808638.1 D-galactonate transporter [Ralstonia sp. LMG 19083]
MLNSKAVGQQSRGTELLSSRVGGKRWILMCPSLFLFWAVANIDKVGISAIAANDQFLQEMGISGQATEIGKLMTAFTLSYGLSSVIWGYLVDRVGPRRTAMLGIYLWGLSLVIGGFASHYDQVLLSRLILGLGEGMLFPVTNKYISEWFHPKELGKAQASWIYGAYAGPALGLPLVIWISGEFCWQISFFVLAGVALMANLPLIYFITRDTPALHPSVSEAEVNYIQENRHIYTDGVKSANFHKDPKYWSINAAFLMAAALFYGITFWMPTYLQKSHGFSAKEIKSALPLSWIFAVFSVSVVAFLADRTKRPALIAIIIFLICGVALIAVPMQNERGAVTALLALALGCTASELLLSQLMLVNLAASKATGKAAGVMGLLNLLGGFVTTFMGFIVDKTGGNFNAAFLCLASAPFLGSLAYVCLARHEGAQLLERKAQAMSSEQPLAL